MNRSVGIVVVLIVAASAAGCCFANGHGLGGADTGPVAVAFDPAHAGEGVLPTPAVSFAGVSPPYPDPLAARGTEGAIVRSGTATVRTISGNLPGVATGTVCSYVEYRHVGGDYECRWNVSCLGHVLYGLGTAGYQHCEDSTWPVGTLMFDPNTSRIDNDPSFIFNSAGLSVSDDPAGALGAFTVTLGVP